MRTAVQSNLAAFNQRVLERQEEAYTLAYYLTGSDDLAEKAVKDAVLQAYRETGLNLATAGLHLLRAVIQGCRQRRETAAGGNDLAAELQALPHEARCAVLLVDVLGYSYAEAGRVLVCPAARVCEYLTQGRLAMLRYG